MTVKQWTRAPPYLHGGNVCVFFFNDENHHVPTAHFVLQGYYKITLCYSMLITV